MNEPSEQKDDRDRRYLLWYWLPVVGAGIGLTFVFLIWLLGP